MTANLLTLNSSKTAFMVIGLKNQNTQVFLFTILASAIQETSYRFRYDRKVIDWATDVLSSGEMTDSLRMR